jgi:OmcA/MtrC family decaheme c-type cytochrome
MSRHRSSVSPSALVVASLLVCALTGCSGGDNGGSSSSGSGGSAAGATPVTGNPLNINITSVSINGPPVITFRVTDKAGAGVPTLVPADLGFNIAKLVPGLNGEPTNWQDYLNRAVNGAVQGSEERLAAGFAFGTLLNQGGGNYMYTFATDITNAAANPCPAPCSNADGKALNISYQSGLTHRVTIQQANAANPKATGVLDFVPAGGAASARDIVLTATCNQCHAELTAHVTRVDTKLCVTCHNPGSWVAGPPNTSVDFKVMIHKIHYNNAGAALPSVLAGTPYKIGSKDFSAVVFTQDVRNCTRCHDGALSAQGDNWKNRPSMEACGSCHDDVYFGAQPDPAKPYQTVAHPGGVETDNSTCFLCHGPGRVSDVTVKHNLPARLKAAEAKFKLNIIGTTPTNQGGFPVVTFSVTDPTNGDQPYDIKADPRFTATASGDSTLAVSIGWNTNATLDFGNDGNAANFGQPISIDALANSVAGSTAGTYTVTSPVAIPVTQTGTLRVTMDGHPAGDVTTPGTFTDRLAVRSVFKDFPITVTPVARRSIVDIAKCNVCHDVLSVHGNNRTDEPGVCVVCHNPNATDANRRPSSGGVLTGGVDGKLEEAVDFRTMIHAIHAGQASNGGFREKGIVIYGSSGARDFSTLVFPGKLSNCTACHVGSSYLLTGIWAPPTANGILGTTTTTDPATHSTTGSAASDAVDNLRTSPTAAVCSSCHDTAVAKAHMQDAFNGGSFSATQATINATVENCTFCHGDGKVLNVKAVHGIP